MHLNFEAQLEDAKRWRCDCGAWCEPASADWRFTGSYWEHSHGGQSGHFMATRVPGAEWRVFQVNDCDWWLARSVDEARQNAAEYYDCQPDDEQVSEVAEITEAELDRLQYFPDANRKGASHSFREELAARIVAGARVEMFATTEF